MANVVTHAPNAFAPYAFALFALLFGVNAPIPLFESFRQQLSLDPEQLALFYSIYCGVVIAILPIIGTLSDHVGRRYCVMGGLAIATVASAILGTAQSFDQLLAGRILQGVAIAIVSAPAAAAMAELTKPRTAAIATTLAMALGGSLGPFFSGMLAEMIDRLWIFSFDSLLSCIAIIVMWGALDPRMIKTTKKPENSILRSLHRPFWTACWGVIIAFGVQTTFFTMSGSRLSILAADAPYLIAGGSMGLFMGCSGIGQWVGRKAKHTQAIGTILLVTGASLFFLGPSWISFALLSGMLSGFGHGFAYIGCLQQINESAPSRGRGTYTGLFYGAVYIGGGLPVLGVGMLIKTYGLETASALFCAILAICTVILLLMLWWPKKCVETPIPGELHTKSTDETTVMLCTHLSNQSIPPR